MIARRLLLLAVGLALAAASPIDGARLRVIDGDTVALGSEHIRLLDIDAPEISHPRCPAETPAAAAALDRLAQLLRGPAVIERHGKDRYGRTLARISVNGRDVGARLLAEGFAIRWKPGRDAWDARAAHWCGRR
ncbi:thermonuclease family protein [Azorhizobium caulinodans]|uniref:thermonuclease family protein n=1 Tax=Azorhizobium caulinodans TaxID=7 RepID=UPI002FBEE0DD